MVKASSSQRPSSCCSPPLASLSLASAPLKPCKPSPFFSFPNRPRTLPMEPPSSLSENVDDSSTTDILPPMATSKSAETPTSSEDDPASVNEKQGSMCSRQRLQQHRIQISSNVIIPETWGREQQLQEWVSYGIVEDALRPPGLMSARTALVSDCGNKPGRASPPLSADVEVS